MANVLARWRGRERLVALAVLCLFATFGLTASQTETSFAQTAGKPNILFILTDDMRADDLKFMPKTRNLLANQGVTFKNAFVTRSLCCPSRATIFRGQYAHNHRVWVNVIMVSSIVYPPDPERRFWRPSDREDIVYRDRGQLGLYSVHLR